MRLFEPGDEAAPTGPLRRVMLLIAYDGTGYRGFAAQPGQRTVAGALSSAIGRVAGHEVALSCAGRTDSGVHALGQVVHTDIDAGAVARLSDGPVVALGGLDRLKRSVTGQLAGTIVALDARVAPDGFDARRSALSRRYRYDLLVAGPADPLLRHVSWHVASRLDLAAMRIASDGLLGEHDFAAFCRRPPNLPDGPICRKVLDARWTVAGPGNRLLRFEIEANAFCHQMVRSIVGMLVEIGSGRFPASEMVAVLASSDRSRASRLAPPSGLCLDTVRYPPELVPGGVWAVEA